MNKRILGEIVNINPVYENCDLLYVTLEQYRDGTNFTYNPSFWIVYKDVLYYAICSYNMNFLETFSDWSVGTKKYFDEFQPKKDEFEHIIKMNPVFYKVEFEKIKNFLDEFSEYEMDLIRPYQIKENRNNKINDIL